jgi:hypothetical protein
MYLTVARESVAAAVVTCQLSEPSVDSCQCADGLREASGLGLVAPAAGQTEWG